MDLKNKLLTLPKNSGCYLMKNKAGQVIYVGKAINLFNRVNSYFRGSHDYKTAKLVKNIVDFDYIVVQNEKEALVLEYNLIKKYNPQFNIVFRDDQSYPYILLRDKELPFCEIIRLNKHKKHYAGKLFGPYPNAKMANIATNLINRLYSAQSFFPLSEKICNLYNLPVNERLCLKDLKESTLNRMRHDIKVFLNGDTSLINKILKEIMQEASFNLDYERAAIYRDLLLDLDYLKIKVDVQINTRRKVDFDLFNYYLRDGYIAITGLFIRQSKLLSIANHLDYLVGDVENYVSRYLYHYYENNQNPKVLYLPANLLTYLGDSLPFEVAGVKRGYKKSLMNKAYLNAQTHLNQQRDLLLREEENISKSQEELNNLFAKEIHKIELFDNSHTAGKLTVAAMVCFVDFKPYKKGYRYYKLTEGASDYDSMKEVLYRRYFNLLVKKETKPDLLIVDGGYPQIKAAKEIMAELNLDITIAGLSKDDHHRTRYLLNERAEKLSLTSKSNLFFILTNMQDEVHRFVIQYHRRLRQKNMYHSIFDEIVGLGPKRRLALLKKYKTLASIKMCSLADLENVLPTNVAKDLYTRLREDK